ncbi:diguanylate cyclase [Simiduia curdlanivorans]|uniref:diguanylate cyclase domain-containing protein n=1 Tax=Simiduia curdlanivorans TaxID=1492769 RepID=UPI0025B3126A|nr:diguanylate cyclase [Simiduia curdlanivorans]MDN3637220.1 diguanylate cyclase [Simiduia curdlanivorans]
MLIKRCTSRRSLHFIQEAYLIATKEINISASLGIAMYPEHGTNVQDLLINADVAMLASKEQGRNTFYCFPLRNRSARCP